MEDEGALALDGQWTSRTDDPDQWPAWTLEVARGSAFVEVFIDSHAFDADEAREFIAALHEAIIVAEENGLE